VTDQPANRPEAEPLVPTAGEGHAATDPITGAPPGQWVPQTAAGPATYWVRPEPSAPTPAPGYVYAGFWRRTVGFIIDGIILTIASYAILIPIVAGAFSGTAPDAFLDPNAFTIDPVTGRVVANAEALAALGQMTAQLFRWVGITFALQAAYFIILWTWRGASLGQMAVGVEVRDEKDGRRIGFLRSGLRYVGFIVSAWILFIGFIWVAFDQRKQGWHDKIAGTYVVRRVR